jgi:hypothetical protein
MLLFDRRTGRDRQGSESVGIGAICGVFFVVPTRSTRSTRVTIPPCAR